MKGAVTATSKRVNVDRTDMRSTWSGTLATCAFEIIIFTFEDNSGVQLASVDRAAIANSASKATDRNAVANAVVVEEEST